MGICLFCGLETARTLKYCDKKCSKQQYLKDRRLKKIQLREIENLKCRICNITIINIKRHYFCSPECQKIYTKEQKKSLRISKKQILKPKTKAKKVIYESEKTQTLKCKCPKCGKFHIYTFTPAWIGNGMPKIYCLNCRFLKVPESYENIGDYNKCKI